MKAIIKSKKELSNRVKLEEVIPLRTPFSIFIDPSDKCNFKCKFCPTGDIDLMKKTAGRNFGNMDFDLYKKIIDDLNDFDDNIKLLHLYKEGEPLLNPNFPKMVEYAKNSKKINKISTTTNAYLLNEQLSSNIIEAGLDRINISIEGINEEQYFNIANVKIDFQKLVNKITYFYNNKNKCEVAIKIVGNNLTEDDKKKFYNIFGDISDFIFIENISPAWSGFEIDKSIKINKDISIIGDKIKYTYVCPQIFYSIAINSNGTSSPCCSDWSRYLIIGDINKSSLIDIWNGELLKKLRIDMLKKNRIYHSICSGCGVPVYNATDNIDEYADEILKRLY